MDNYDTDPDSHTPRAPHMSRKPKKGYFVKGQFVAEGSELDLELKRELKGGLEISRTDLKRESTELQALGEQLMDLRAGLFAALPLSDKLVEAIKDAKRITNFEGKRRQMQFVGKLMRQLDEATLQAVREALDVQRHGSAKEAAARPGAPGPQRRQARETGRSPAPRPRLPRHFSTRQGAHGPWLNMTACA
jgi:hypothetical protein